MRSKLDAIYAGVAKERKYRPRATICKMFRIMWNELEKPDCDPEKLREAIIIGFGMGKRMHDGLVKWKALAENSNK